MPQLFCLAPSRSIARKLMIIAVAVAGMLTCISLAVREAPQFADSGSRMLLHEPVPPFGAQRHSLQPAPRIVAMGDSNTIGRGTTGYPRQLERMLAGELAVANFGSGGDTAVTGARRWQGRENGQLLIVMYGSNDAAPRWVLSTRKPVPIATFEAAIVDIARRGQSAGAQVLVLAPLPTSSLAMEERIQPYRFAARRAAAGAGASFADPVVAFEGRGAELEIDGLHLSSLGERRLAIWLARRISVAQHPASPRK